MERETKEPALASGRHDRADVEEERPPSAGDAVDPAILLGDEKRPRALRCSRQDRRREIARDGDDPQGSLRCGGRGQCEHDKTDPK
jgi:hypothetical protein